MTKHEDLEVGHEFPFVSYELTPSAIDKYKEAVDDCSQVSTFVPPLAIAAYTIRAMSASLSLPPGSVHALQELEFFKPVIVGSCIDCHARVIQKINRAKFNMIMIELNAFDHNKDRVLSGKATLLLAESG